MAEKVKLTGSVLGVSFDVVAAASIDESGKALTITGEAWGMPVEIKVAADDDTISVTGTLLGNEFTISGAAPRPNRV